MGEGCRLWSGAAGPGEARLTRSEHHGAHCPRGSDPKNQLGDHHGVGDLEEHLQFCRGPVTPSFRAGSRFLFVLGVLEYLILYPFLKVQK